MPIRDLDPTSPIEIALVADRMRETLIEVEGFERGSHLYSLAWLEDRVRWHLDPANTRARVLLALDSQNDIVGHTIFRIESPDQNPFGLISTTYVLPQVRRSGWASQFIELAHEWFRAHSMTQCCTCTSSTNRPLITLYQKFGYKIVEQGPNDLTDTTMVKLAVQLT